MSRPGAILVEAQIEARAVEVDATIDLRPLPVWCPLPRREDDPKVTAVGWVAGRQAARTEGVLLTTTWCRVDLEPPPAFVSRPAEVLRVDRLPEDAGRLWALSRPRSFDWLQEALSTTRRFRASLDLGAINERRAGIFAGLRWSGPHQSRPVFGRGWWLPGEEAGQREETKALGALDDRFILLGSGGPDEDEASLIERVEQAVERHWRAAQSHSADK